LTSRNAGLGPDGLVAEVDIGADGLDGLGDVAAVGVAIDHHAVTAAAAQQLVQRHAGHLGLDIPQRHVDGRDGPHGHRTPAPVGAAIEILPDVLDPARVLADQAGDHVVVQIRDHRLLAAVQGGVADSIDALVGLDLQGDEVAARTGDDSACG